MRWADQQIYFAEACGKVKIGCSVNPEVRIPQVSDWIPHPVTLIATMPGGYALETAIHKMFDAEWSHGEWFTLSPRIQAFIDRILAGEPLEIDVVELNTRRRKHIADKKWLTRRRESLYRATGSDLPSDLLRRVKAVPKGHPCSPNLLEDAHAYIDGKIGPAKRERAA